MRMPPGSLIAVRYAGDCVWHERLLLWPVRSDKGHGAWLTEDGAGKLRDYTKRLNRILTPYARKL